jgi:hypothetical protein
MKIKYIPNLLLSIFFLNNCILGQTKEIQEKISKMVEEHNAIDNWEYVLTKGVTRKGVTIQINELEKLWSADKQFLYYGHIRESIEYDNSHYLLLIDRNPFIDFKYFYYPEIRLSLTIPKIVFDGFLNHHSDFYGEYGFNNSIALIANIDSISSMTEYDDKGYDYELLIGHGKLLDIAYIGFIAL